MTFAVSYEAYLPNAIDREDAAFQFTENQTATVSSFGRFYFYASQRREGRPKQTKLPWFLRFLTDFRFADFRMVRISAFPHFRFSVFPAFCISGLACQPAFDLVEPVEWKVYLKS